LAKKLQLSREEDLLSPSRSLSRNNLVAVENVVISINKETMETIKGIFAPNSLLASATAKDLSLTHPLYYLIYGSLVLYLPQGRTFLIAF
jgi:hypothetical protein